MTLVKVISGGQIGADRAGLDWALSQGLEIGGWCPRGRLALDGKIPDKYPLVETVSPEYPARTINNVQDSDATVIFTRNPPGAGSLLTEKFCKYCGKPYFIFYDGSVAYACAMNLVQFLDRNCVKILNVAGSRDLYQFTWNVLSCVVIREIF